MQTADASRAMLDSLLAQNAEGRHLDFKRELDLSDQASPIELAKDVAAMSMLGGHIIIGINDDGSPSKRVDAGDLSSWDEARLAPRLQRWLPDSVEIRVCAHDTEEWGLLILVAVAAHRDGLAVIKAVANVSDSTGRQRAVLRQGDIFARHGTRSERATQQDIHEAVTRAVDTGRESLRKEMLSELLAQQSRALTSGAISTGSASQLTWTLPVTTLCESVVDLLRRDDRIPLRYLQASAGTYISAALTQPTNDLSLDELLDRFAALAGTGAIADDEELFTQGVAGLVQTYRRTMNASGAESQGLAVRPPTVWLEVLQRVEALGGLLVRLEQWGRLRHLALGSGSIPSDDFHGNWLRHGVTWAARHGVEVEQQDPSEPNRGLVGGGLSVARRVAELRPDLLDTDNELLDSICQFDALAALVGMSAGGEADGRFYYPNFAAYPPQRTEPIFERVVRDEPMKAALDLGEDKTLAAILTELLRAASQEGGRRNMQWWMVDRLQVNVWLNEHRDQGQV